MDSADKAKKDFFISYTGADEQIASWIAWVLEDAGYEVVIQAWDMRQAGKSVIGNIDQAAKECARTVAVVSPEYFTSDFTRLEWETAMHSDPTAEKGLLIPVIVHPHEIEGVMKRLAHISLVGLDEAQAETALLNGFRSDTRFKPASKPAYNLNRAKKKPRFPGTIPEHCNLPHRNPNFSGREKVLSVLRESMLHERHTALTQQALYGLGGIGKTQLAVEYAYRHSASYEVIWWIRSEEPSTLASDYAALALELNLPEKEEARQAVVVQAVTRWLEHNDNWLLVFDNARDADSIRSYLPRSASGHVLITSRNPDWKSLVNPLPVEVWERNESVAFLLERTGRTDDAGANALAEALGDLPLALEQAAAYCDNKKKSFADYLTLFNTRRAELWNREKAPDGYHSTVATTWSLAFEEIRKVPMAEELLSLCSVVAPDAIPRTLLNKALADYTKAVKKAKSVDEFVIDEAYEALSSYSLITLDETFVTVHRLVQLVVRDRMNEDDFAKYRNAMVVALSEQFPKAGYDDPLCWPECAILLPHANAVFEGSQHDNDDVSYTRTLLMNWIAGYHFGRALYANAELLYRRIIEIRERKLEAHDPQIGIGLNNLAVLLHDKGDYKEAELILRRSLDITEKYYGSNHPEVANRLNNLGILLKDKGDYKEAELILRRSLGITEKYYGANHSEIVTILNNLGLLLNDTGRRDEALRCHRRVLKILIKHYGDEHLYVAKSLKNISSLLLDKGNIEEAELKLRRSLAIAEKHLGLDHPDVASILNSLAILMKNSSRDDEALLLYRRALKILINKYGTNHIEVAMIMNNLGVLLQVGRVYKEAESLQRRSLHIMEKILGMDHSKTVIVRENYEYLLQLINGR
jgi:tetratricopeptide (TPR) repeat protein